MSTCLISCGYLLSFEKESRLWLVLACFGVPEKMLTVVRQFHEGVRARVRTEEWWLWEGVASEQWGRPCIAQQRLLAGTPRYRQDYYPCGKDMVSAFSVLPLWGCFFVCLFFPGRFRFFRWFRFFVLPRLTALGKPSFFSRLISHALLPSFLPPSSLIPQVSRSFFLVDPSNT